MWNQASTSGPGGSGGVAGGGTSMSHTAGTPTSNVRSNSMANNVSAHRRVGGIGQTQHVSSPSNSAGFPRPFPNLGFPGTVSTPRSAAAPNTTSAPQRPLQRLPILTTQTPISIARLAFSPQTTVHWYHLQKPGDDTVADVAVDHQQQHTSTSTTAAPASSSQEEARKAWNTGIQQIIASVNQSRSRPSSAEDPQRRNQAALQLLLKDPLVYTSSTRSQPAESAQHAHRASRSDLWLFVVVTGAEEPKNSAAAASTTDTSLTGAAQTSIQDAAASQETLVVPSTTNLLSQDLIQSLARLSSSVNARSGSYRLSAAAAAVGDTDGKGKQSSLTEEQRQAHKRFMTSVKARIIDSLAAPSSSSPEQDHAEKPPKRTRFRLGESVVFLPARRSDSRLDAVSDAHWFAAPGQSKMSLGGATQSGCFLTRVTVCLTATSLFVHAKTRRLAALPLFDTRYAIPTDSLPSSTASPSVLIAPLGCQVQLIGTVAANSIAEEHLSELASKLATLNGVPRDEASELRSLFASGVAICALPLSTFDPRSNDQQSHQPEPQPLQSTSLVTPAQVETEDQVMAPASTACEHEPPRSDAAQSRSVSRQFLWPAAWCLVLQGRTGTSSSAPAPDELQSMQSQPMTPLKELVSFTLKVLNDANESSLAHNAPPYTPGEPDDASLARHGVDRIPSTRPDITPASITFPDFDFAMPTVASATSSNNLPAAGQSVPATSPLKRENFSVEPVPGATATDAFAQNLNWMQFLPSQSSEAPAPSSASAFVMQENTASLAGPASRAGPTALGASAQASEDAQHLQTGSSWPPSNGPASNPIGAGADAAAQPSSIATSQSHLQPQTAFRSHGTTPSQEQGNTPLALTQPTSTKRKAGEGDIFGNLGLLTEDDFSFFDESAFGLNPDDALPQHMDQPVEAAPMASSRDLNYDQGIAMADHSNASTHPLDTQAQPATSASAIIDDVAMDDVGHSSLDALFSAIPGLQDAMASTNVPQAQIMPPQAHPSSVAATQSAYQRPGHNAAEDMAATTSGSAHPFHPSMSSFTPRDVSGATPFGDPASLPGFTPSSLTESSPAFGNLQYKTPRTPYSPVEEYRDGATIVDLQNGTRPGGSAQATSERNAASATDPHGSSQPSFAKSEIEDQLRLADASTAAAAAAHAAMDLDPSNKKRPAIVPNAFLPLPQPEARKPLQRLAAGARANLGRKYDLLGKFASRPKPATAVTTSSNTIQPQTTGRRASGDAGKVAARTDRESAADASRPGGQTLDSRFGTGASRPSPSKTPSGRGQALLQLRRDRHSKTSPGSALTGLRRSSSSRLIEGPATPRSSDDFARPGAMSATDSDTSSTDDDDSDDALSDTETTALTLSAADQATLKASSLDIVSSYLCGAMRVPGKHHSADARSGSLAGEALDLPTCSNGLPVSFLPPITAVSNARAAALLPRPTVRRWMLSRTAAWLIQNPQFRSMYGGGRPNGVALSDVATSNRLEVLEAMASALSIAPATKATHHQADADAASASTEAEVRLVPTLRGLVKPSAGASTDDVAEAAEVLEPARIAVGCQGSVVEALPSALTLWDKSKLSAVSGHKHVVAKVLLTDASPAWHEEIVAWLGRLRVAFESHGLGTHVGGAHSILAVADGSESLALSSCLDQLWRDGETWLDTLRSISSRVQLDLLQGKHVVVYTLQPPTSTACASTGFHGLLRLEADLRAMLSEQVGVLAEQLVVRAISPSMMTESGSLGFGQQSQTLRRLAFSVYDQLPRLVRRQPAKVLHGKEPGPISAIVQFPAFSLSTAPEPSTAASSVAGNAERTNFSLSWPQEPASVTDEHVLLHVGYRICQTGTGDRVPGRGGSSTSFDATSMFGLGNFGGADQPASGTRESIVMVSAIDERGMSSTVDALAAKDGNCSIEACLERVWRFALAEASRARAHWRLIISSTGLMSQRELRAWQRLIGAYLSSTEVRKRVFGSVLLLSVRPDESGAVLAERGERTKPSQGWTMATAADKSNLVLLDAADFSQTVKFAEPMPMEWTQALDVSPAITEEWCVAEEQEQEEEEATVLPIASAILMHRSRTDPISGSGSMGNDNKMNSGQRQDGTTPASHVLAVDMLHAWSCDAAHGKDAHLKEGAQQHEAMEAVLRSLHRLRLISQERHQLPWPYSAQPWSVASVNTLAACLDGVVLGD